MVKCRLLDNVDNVYPPEDDVHTTCSKTENFNGELTIDILREVLFMK